MTSISASSEKTAVNQPPTSDEQPIVSQTPFELNNLPQRTPPNLGDACILHGRSPKAGQVHVLISQSAWQQVVAHANSNTGVELGGALLGTAYQNNGEIYVEVHAAIPAASKDHGPIHFTFSADSWSHLHRDRAAKYPNLDMIGWFHTHPGLGVFYSGDDVVVHSAAFTLPWHVGLVVDPLRRESCFFGWVNKELKPFAGFFEMVTEQAASVVEWRVVRTAVWQDSYEPSYPTTNPDGQGMYLPQSERSLVPSFNPGIGFIIGGLGLLLALVMLLGWVLPLNRQVNHLESVVLSLANGNAATCPDPSLRLILPTSQAPIKQGSVASLLGTANYTETNRYQVEIRPANTPNWILLDVIRRRTDFGELTTWDTQTYQPGVYELQLTAVDTNNLRLANTSLCIVQVELIP